MCVLFCEHIKKKKMIIAVDCHIKVIILGCDLENCFGHIVLPWQRTVIGFQGASRLVMVERFSPTPTRTTLRLSVTLDGIAHDRPEQSSAFFLMFLLHQTRECDSRKHVQSYLKTVII